MILFTRSSIRRNTAAAVHTMAAIETGLPKGNVAALVNRMSRADLTNKLPISTKPTTMRPSGGQKSLRIATFAYDAAEKDELDLLVGDILEFIKESEDGWAIGKRQRDGREGLFPTNFVDDYKQAVSPSTTRETISTHQIGSTTSDLNQAQAQVTRSATAAKRISQSESTPVPNENTINGNTLPQPQPTIPTTTATPPKTSDVQEMARVLYTYQASNADEISLSRVGQLVKIVDKNPDDPGWMLGELDGKKGLFPENFVEIVKVSSSPSQKPPARLPGGAPTTLTIATNLTPPIVPAKPPKNVLSSSTSNVSTEPMLWTSQSVPGRPSSATTTATNQASGRQTSGGVNALKNQLMQQGLFSKPPAVPGENPLSKSLHHTQSTQQSEPLGPSIDEPLDADAGTSQLVHINKSRPKQAMNRRPMSVYAGKRNSQENLLDETQMSRSAIASSTGNLNHKDTTDTPYFSIHHNETALSAKIPDEPLKIEKESIHKEEIHKEEPRLEPKAAIVPPFSSVSIKSVIKGAHDHPTPLTTTIQSNQKPIEPVFPKPATITATTENNVDLSQWVRRSDYESLLRRIAILEDRVAHLERQK